MTEPSKTLQIRIHLEHTPSPNDPEGASEFYQALGMLAVAFGRLEGHFLACILDILQMPATSVLSRRLPQGLSAHAKIWEHAFRISPTLNPHEKDALNFLTELRDVANDRNRIIHGLWERFNFGVPLGATSISVKHKKGTETGIELRRTIITLDQVIAVARKASRLNIELHGLSTILSAERGIPPSDVDIF